MMEKVENFLRASAKMQRREEDGWGNTERL